MLIYEIFSIKYCECADFSRHHNAALKTKKRENTK